MPVAKKLDKKPGIIRAEKSTVFSSRARLLCTRNLLSERKLDAILSVQGIDSRYNEGMQEFFNYMTLGQWKSYADELTRLGYEEDVINDAILCIKKDRVEVYCNPAIYTYLLQYAGVWPNTTVHCLTEQQYDDTETAEEFKMKCFVSMVSDCKQIAIPYHSSSHNEHQKFDKMLIEQWPLIQAYALEGYGSGTFFTLQHEVSDISTALAQLYQSFDGVKTEQFISENLPTYFIQWESLIRNVEVQSASNFPAGFTESQAAEPLVTYYNHGMVFQEQFCAENIWQKPFVKMGVNTNNLSDNFNYTNQDIKTAGPKGTFATHMVLHGVAPRSGLACTRTYFFGPSALPAPVGGNEDYHNESIEQLSRVYRVVVESTLRSVAEFCTCHSGIEVIENCKKNISSILQKFLDCRRLNILVEIKSNNRDGRLAPLGDDSPAAVITVLSVCVTGIYNPSNVEEIIGGVAFSESFLFSSIRYGVQSTDLDNSFILLTENIPRWVSWNVCHKSILHSRNLDELVNDDIRMTNVCGDMLIDGQAAELVTPQCWLQPIQCALYLFDHAVIIQSPSLGLITLARTDIKSVSFYDGGGPAYPAFVVLYTSMEFQLKTPHQLYNSNRLVVLSLSPRTKAYKKFHNVVIQAWKKHEADSFRISMDDNLPEILTPVYSLVSANFLSQASGQYSESSIKALQKKCNITGYQHFLSHIRASSLLPSGKVFEKEAISLVTKQGDESHMVAEDNSVILLITIIAGLPGSHKDALANSITKLTQEKSRTCLGWVIHRQTPETSHRFDGVKLENTLTSIYGVLKKKANTGVKCSRLLIVSPGYTDIRSIVSTILHHPNEELRRHVRIGSVTTCVDPGYTYLFGYRHLPGLLEQCALGWVNNIVLTSSNNDKLSNVQEMIRVINPSVSFIISDKGEITRSQDIDLILSENAFTHPDMVKLRLLDDCPGMMSAESYGMNTVFLEFKQPLVKQVFFSKIKAFHEKLSSYQFDNLVLSVCGRLCFTETEDMYDIVYTAVNNMLACSPALVKSGEQVPVWFMSFTGYHVEENTIKNFLRSCAQSKPERKELMTVQGLSPATKNSIHMAKHLEPLPPGWYYNGCQYVDMSGEKLDKHPNYQQFLQEYVARMNESIKLYNEEINIAEYKDLFD